MKPTFNEAVGVFLKNRRESHNLSQSDVASSMDIGPTTISRLESGQTRITVEQFMSYLDVLGFSMESSAKELQDIYESTRQKSLWEGC